MADGEKVVSEAHLSPLRATLTDFHIQESLDYMACVYNSDRAPEALKWEDIKPAVERYLQRLFAGE